jgi:hypothetical protein
MEGGNEKRTSADSLIQMANVDFNRGMFLCNYQSASGRAATNLTSDQSRTIRTKPTIQKKRRKKHRIHVYRYTIALECIAP